MAPKRKPGRGVDATGRSRGADQHVRLHHWMMQTVAWRTLPPTSRALLVELYALYRGDNNGDIYLSIRQAAKRCCCHKDTASRSLKDLQERGFIRKAEPGSFDWKTGAATRWELTEFPLDGMPATKDFRRWKPAERDASEKNAGPRIRTERPSKPTTRGLKTDQPPAECPSKATRQVDSAPPHGPSKATTVKLPGGGAAVPSAPAFTFIFTEEDAETVEVAPADPPALAMSITDDTRREVIQRLKNSFPGEQERLRKRIRVPKLRWQRLHQYRNRPGYLTEDERFLFDNDPVVAPILAEIVAEHPADAELQAAE